MIVVAVIINKLKYMQSDICITCHLFTSVLEYLVYHHSLLNMFVYIEAFILGLTAIAYNIPLFFSYIGEKLDVVANTST